MQQILTITHTDSKQNVNGNMTTVRMYYAFINGRNVGQYKSIVISEARFTALINFKQQLKNRGISWDMER